MPLARTRWTRFYLDPVSKGFSKTPMAGPSIAYDTMGEGVTFSTEPMTEEMEVTGPVAAKLFLSSKTKDADVFLTLRLYDPQDKEVLFIGSNDPNVPIALGWRRASHRKLDPDKTLPYRPYHAHDELWPLKPDVPVELDVEIWPTCIVVPKGYRLALTIKGCDYDHGRMPPALIIPPFGIAFAGSHATPSGPPQRSKAFYKTPFFAPLPLCVRSYQRRIQLIQQRGQLRADGIWRPDLGVRFARVKRW